MKRQRGSSSAVARWREWRRGRQQRWVEKQAAKSRPGSSHADLWKSGGGDGGGAGGGL